MSNETRRILLVEDEKAIRDAVTAYLERENYWVTAVGDGQEALEEFSKHHFDLVILDLMLPRVPGERVCRAIRDNSDVPIIMLTAKGEVEDRIIGLELGADDYLVKPFDLDELLARVTVQLRHAARAEGRSAISGSQGKAEGDGRLRYKDWVIDSSARTFRVAGEPIKLTRIEYNIVEALVRRPKKVFTKQELFEVAWNEECFIEEKAINVHVSNIRGKLKPSGTDSYIETVWGIGFKLAE